MFIIPYLSLSKTCIHLLLSLSSFLDEIFDSVYEQDKDKAETKSRIIVSMKFRLEQRFSSLCQVRKEVKIDAKSQKTVDVALFAA